MRQLATVRFYSSDADRISRSSSRSRKTRPDDGDYGIVNVNADNRGLSRALAHRNVRSNASGYQRRQDFFTSHVQWASPAMMASNCRSNQLPWGTGETAVGTKDEWIALVARVHGVTVTSSDTTDFLDQRPGIVRSRRENWKSALAPFCGAWAKAGRQGNDGLP